MQERAVLSLAVSLLKEVRAIFAGAKRTLEDVSATTDTQPVKTLESDSHLYWVIVPYIDRALPLVLVVACGLVNQQLFNLAKLAEVFR